MHGPSKRLSGLWLSHTYCVCLSVYRLSRRLFLLQDRGTAGQEMIYSFEAGPCPVLSCVLLCLACDMHALICPCHPCTDHTYKCLSILAELSWSVNLGSVTDPPWRRGCSAKRMRTVPRAQDPKIWSCEDAAASRRDRMVPGPSMSDIFWETRRHDGYDDMRLGGRLE